MSNNIFYSAKTNSFYPSVLRESYDKAGTWPDDAVEVTDKAFEKFTGTPPDGKQRGSNSKGEPAWVSIPEPTAEEKRASNVALQTQIIDAAKSDIQFLQTQLLLDMISDTDKEVLKKQIQYIKDVQSVDLSNPQWPEKPV